MSKTFLIIGSNSFSGSNFIKLILDKGFKVIATSRSNELDKKFLNYKNSKNLKKLKFYKCDLNKDLNKIKKIINKYKPSIIVNYAAQGMVEQSWDRPEDWYFTNLYSQTKFYNLLLQYKFIKRIIHVSTPEVYGSTKGKIKENYSFNPTTPYAISRAAMDFHLIKFFKFKKLPIILTRTANIYGPGQQLYRVIPKSLYLSRNKKNFPLDGNGNTKRSFIYVDDASLATFKICMRGKLGQTYHISTDDIKTIKSVLKIVCKVSGRNFNNFVKNHHERLGKDYLYYLNSNKLKRELNWKPKTNLEVGIKKTLEWIDKNLKLFKENELIYKHKK